MGDAGEGLIDAEARIQERIEELKTDRAVAHRNSVKRPEEMRKLAALELARKEMTRQLAITTHVGRQTQIRDAIAEIDRGIAAMQAAISL